MTSVTDAPHYALDHAWEHERRRLGLLERFFDPFSRRRLTAVGVRRGARCLELGAGAGSIARWLCTRVGPTGHVTATDLGIEWLAHLDEPNLTVLTHDLRVDDFPDESFDLIHARAVFEHLADREDALLRVTKWLAPGGWLVIEDVDRISVEQSSTPYGRAFRSAFDTLELAGADYSWARSFPSPLAAAGLTSVGGHGDVPLMWGGTPSAELAILSIQALAERSIAAGIIDRGSIDAALAWLADPASVDLGPAFFGAWGQK